MEIRMGLIMGGKEAIVGKIEVCVNDFITQGQTLLNIETGKGNRPFKTIITGIVTKIYVKEGDKVKAGDILFECEEKKVETSNFEENIIPEKRLQKLQADIIIIGAGPGGYVSAIYAAQKGLKVILVEKEQLGGTCLNHGCIPTKTLLQSAHIYETIKNAEIFGISTQNINFDIKKIIARKEKVCKENREGIEFLLNSNNVKLIYGEATLNKDKRVVVKTKKINYYEVEAENIILATGSKSSIPSWAENSVCIDSKKALENMVIPDSIVIVGGGVIGMEFAFLYSAYGAKVKVLEYADHLLNNIDKSATEVILESSKEKNIDIILSSKVIKIIESQDNKAIIFYEQNGNENVVTADKVLISTGRIPEFDMKNMDELGVKYTKRGIVTDDNYETNIKGIYAIGDVNGKSQLAHSASNQGITVIDKILGKNLKLYPIIPSVIFTNPEIAQVGLTEEECINQGISIKKSIFPFIANGKAKIQNETKGFVKLIKNKENNKIIGGVIVGVDASSLISSITLAITNGLTDQDISKTIFSHPTTSEAVWEAAEGLYQGAIHYHE